MQGTRTWLARLILLLPIALALAGCGNSFSGPEVKEAVERVAGAMEKQTRAVQETRTVGQVIEAPTGETLTLESVETALPGLTPATGERLVVLHVKLVNGGQEPLAIDAEQDFWITEIMGRRYQPVKVEGLPATLAAGQTAEATLAFSVAESAEELRVGWQRNPLTVFTLD